jgi:diguanylate cyclase (GGDEF)-like protein
LVRAHILFVGQPGASWIVVGVKKDPPSRYWFSVVFPTAAAFFGGKRNFELLLILDREPDDERSGGADVVVPVPGIGNEMHELQKSDESVRVDSLHENLTDLSEAFVSLVESAWEPANRKAGLRYFLRRLLLHVPAEECVVYLAENGNGNLRRAHTTATIEELQDVDCPATNPILDNVLRAGTVYLNNNFEYAHPSYPGKTGTPVRSILCLPLPHRGEILGVLEIINRRDGNFSSADVILARAFTRQLAIGLVAMRRFENAERLTITDDLTKLYNYRYLMQYLESEVKRCLRYKKKVSLLFIDVDGFKKINDTFGHLIGSQALSELGQVFRQILRETDVVGRYGGDEFVIVLPETPLSGATLIAERIRKQVEDYEFFAQNLSMRLTVSLGVANCPKHTLTAEGLIKKADAAMYRAKELNKNSIKVAV